LRDTPDPLSGNKRLVDSSRKRRWSWAAFIAVVLICAAFFPTWGFSLLLTPIAVALSVVAWFRSRRDGLFWAGVGLNVLLLTGFAKKLGELRWF
jgi:hypothetical protein